jgi:hypothetical protein
LAGPLCSVCAHPQRREIDRAIATEGTSFRNIEERYGVDHVCVHRHKQAGHVAEALAVYEEEKRGFQRDIGEVFERNVKRLGLAQDACDRWLRDPEEPERYFLGPRAEEVTVLYEETEPDDNARSGFRTVRKKAKLHVLLGEVQERHGIRVTGFETKYADPRNLLVAYSGGLRGEVALFIQSLALVEEKRVRELAEQRAAAQEALNIQELFEAKLGGVLVGILTEQFVTIRGADEETAQSLASDIAAGTLAAIVEAFQAEG